MFLGHQQLRTIFDRTKFQIIVKYILLMHVLYQNSAVIYMKIFKQEFLTNILWFFFLDNQKTEKRWSFRYL